jgi:putative oxidoreductase
MEVWFSQERAARGKSFALRPALGWGWSPTTAFGSEPLMNFLYANLDRLRPYILSILRIVTALLFLQHAAAKVFGFPIAGPPLRGVFIWAAIIETVGGLALLVGAYTRIAAFILSGEMAVAYFMVRSAKSFYPIVNGGEVEIFFCFVCFYLVFAGAGPWSVDKVAVK